MFSQNNLIFNITLKCQNFRIPFDKTDILILAMAQK